MTAKEVLIVDNCRLTAGDRARIGDVDLRRFCIRRDESGVFQVGLLDFSEYQCLWGDVDFDGLMVTAGQDERVLVAGGSKAKWFDGLWQVGWLRVPEKLGKRKCR